MARESMTTKRPLVDFGPFRFDPERGELWRDGEPVALAPLPTRALGLLAERVNRLVTREEMREALWADSHLDWEKSLYHCILKIRQALDEDPQAPRFLETVPRRGYRLKGAVGSPSEPDVEGECDVGADPLDAGTPAPAKWLSRSRGSWLAAAALATALCVGLVTAFGPGSGATGEGSTIETSRLLAEGRFLLERREPAAVERAALRFEEASAVAPRLSAAWAGLAASRAWLHLAGRGSAPAARAAAERALALDAGSVEARRVLGELAIIADWDLERSLAEYEAALALGSEDESLRFRYAGALLLADRSGEAVRQVRAALRRHPVSALLACDAAWYLLYADEPRAAEELARRALALEPTLPFALEALVYSLARQGLEVDAEAYAKQYLSLLDLDGGGEGSPTLREFHARLAGRDYRGINAPVHRALHRAAAGEVQASLDLLEQALAARAPALILRLRDPRLASLHDDARFRGILESLGVAWRPGKATA